MTVAASTLPQRRIGDRPVSAVGLGGAAWSLKPDTDIDAAVATVRGAIELGVTLLDTATAYIPAGQAGHSERLMARAVAEAGAHDVVIASKAGQTRVGDTFPVDGRPETIRRQCEASLVALQTERIDLYYLHQPDPDVPFEDSVAALAQLQAEGKIELAGVSNVDRPLVERALAVMPISAVQNKLSPFDVEHLDLVAWCRQQSIAFTAYSPLGGWEHPSYSAALPVIATIAQEHDVTPEQIALAWELTLAPHLIPILGASRPATVSRSVAAVHVALTSADRRSINQAVRDRHDARTAGRDARSDFEPR